MTIDEAVRDVTKVHCTKSEARRIIEALVAERERAAIQAYIKPHLDVCEEVQTVRVCKNCGLSEMEANDTSTV